MYCTDGRVLLVINESRHACSNPNPSYFCEAFHVLEISPFLLNHTALSLYSIILKFLKLDFRFREVDVWSPKNLGAFLIFLGIKVALAILSLNNVPYLLGRNMILTIV